MSFGNEFWWETDPEVQREAMAAEARMAAARQAQIDAEVDHAVNRLHIRHQAQQQFQRDLDPPEKAVPLTVEDMKDLLPPYEGDRIEGFLKYDQGTLLTAKAGAGKTSLAISLTRALLTGEPFLGTQDVRPLEDDQKVVWLSYDMGPRQLIYWLELAGIDPSRVIIVDQHGRGNPLSDDDERRELAESLRDMNAGYVVCDAFGAAYWGLSQNDAAEVKQFYRSFEQFVRLACDGACEYLMIAHSGHEQAKGARGSTAIGESVGAVFSIDKNDQTKVRKMKSLKFRSDPGSEEMHECELVFREETGLVTAQPSTPAATENEDGTVTVDFSRQEISDAQRRREEDREAVLDAISQLTDHGEGWTSAPEVMRFLDWPEEANRRLRRIMLDLGEEQVLRMSGTGKGRVWTFRTP